MSATESGLNLKSDQNVGLPDEVLDCLERIKGKAEEKRDERLSRGRRSEAVRRMAPVHGDRELPPGDRNS